MDEASTQYQALRTCRAPVRTSEAEAVPVLVRITIGRVVRPHALPGMPCGSIPTLKTLSTTSCLLVGSMLRTVSTMAGWLEASGLGSLSASRRKEAMAIAS